MIWFSTINLFDWLKLCEFVFCFLIQLVATNVAWFGTVSLCHCVSPQSVMDICDKVFTMATSGSNTESILKMSWIHRTYYLLFHFYELNEVIRTHSSDFRCSLMQEQQPVALLLSLDIKQVSFCQQYCVTHDWRLFVSYTQLSCHKAFCWCASQLLCYQSDIAPRF